MDTYIDENGEERFGLTWQEINELFEQWVMNDEKNTPSE